MIFAMSNHEKRRESRLPLEVRVQLQRGDHISTHLCGDISAGGLFVRTEQPWRNGEQVGVRVFLPGVAAPLSLRGEVMRGVSGEGGGMGVRFLEGNRELQRFCQSRGGVVLEKAKKQILLVHGKADLRYFLRSILAVEGYRVHECESFEAAVRFLGEHKPDLLVADPLIRSASSASFAEWLQTHPFHGPVVMVTEGEVIGESPYAGGDYALVAEPVELGKFRTLVWNLVQ
jgi:uncharacterized protein (TIGR02266 family)